MGNIKLLVFESFGEVEALSEAFRREFRIPDCDISYIGEFMESLERVSVNTRHEEMSRYMMVRGVGGGHTSAWRMKCTIS